MKPNHYSKLAWNERWQFDNWQTVFLPILAIANSQSMFSTLLNFWVPNSWAVAVLNPLPSCPVKQGSSSFHVFQDPPPCF